MRCMLCGCESRGMYCNRCSHLVLGLESLFKDRPQAAEFFLYQGKAKIEMWKRERLKRVGRRRSEAV